MMITPRKIWDLSHIEDRAASRLELTDLIRFKGHWYCTFREAEKHGNHPSGRVRIIRSLDGEDWETAALFAWAGADVREIKLSITPEGCLMGNTSLFFVSQEPRTYRYPVDDDGVTPRANTQFHYQLDSPRTPSVTTEAQVARQSVTWLSRDGVHWSGAYAPANGINCWRWDMTWHDGMGYSVAYAGAAENGTLFRTRDGKEWRALVEGFFPHKGAGNEASIAFGNDGTAYCLARDAMPRRHPDKSVTGDFCPMLGIGTAPYYTGWEWKEITIDLGEGGGLLLVEEALCSALHGPRLIRLSDGRLLAAASCRLHGDADGHITLFFLDPATATLRRFADIGGRSYSGIFEHEGRLWVSCGNATKAAIHLAKVELPPND